MVKVQMAKVIRMGNEALSLHFPKEEYPFPGYKARAFHVSYPFGGKWSPKAKGLFLGNKR